MTYKNIIFNNCSKCELFEQLSRHTGRQGEKNVSKQLRTGIPMITVKKLTNALANHYQCILLPQGDYSNQQIGRVDLLRAAPFYSEDTLYLSIGTWPQNLSGSCEGCLVLTDSEDPAPCDLRIIRMKAAVSESGLLLFLADLLSREDRLQMEISRLYQLHHENKSLEWLTTEMEKSIHYPVSVLESSYRMLAVSPMMKELPFGILEENEGKFLSEEEIRSLRRLQIEQRIYENNQAFFVRTKDHPETNWIFCAIRIQNAMAGYVAVCLPGDREADEYQLRLTGVFADICAIEMQKQDFYIGKTDEPYESLLIGMLEGRFTDLAMIESRMKILGHDPGKYYCMIALECPVPHDSNMFNKRQLAALRKYYTNSLSVVYKDRIVLFITQNTPVLLTEKFLTPLENFCRHNNMIAGISQPFADLDKVNLYYEQALSTLRLRDSSDHDKIMLHSTDALLPYLFSNCDYSGLQIGIHHHLFQLIDHDRTNHTRLLETLRIYLECGRRASEAAEKLHLHRSSMFYRLKKIEELLDISLEDEHLLFLYELSFQIMDYLSR